MFPEPAKHVLLLVLGLTAASLLLAGVRRPPPDPPPRAPPVEGPAPRRLPAAPAPAAVRTEPAREEGEPRDAVASPPVSFFEVTVLGPGDVPLLGAWVSPEDGEGGGLVDGLGRIRLPRAPGVQRLSIRLEGTVPLCSRTLVANRTVLRFPDLPSLDLELVSGETGERLAGGRVALRIRGRRVQPLVDRDGRHHLPCLPVTPGDWVWLRLHVDPPCGYVTEDAGGGFDLDGKTSLFTRRVTGTVVVWPEADLRLLVTEADGRPAAGVRVGAVRFLRRYYPVSASPTDAGGVTRIRGIPAIPGERLVLLAEKEGRRAVCEPVTIERSTVETWAVVVLPPAPGPCPFFVPPSGTVPG